MENGGAVAIVGVDMGEVMRDVEAVEVFVDFVGAVVGKDDAGVVLGLAVFQ